MSTRWAASPGASAKEWGHARQVREPVTSLTDLFPVISEITALEELPSVVGEQLISIYLPNMRL
jgi:hypothetical protein